MIKHFTDLEVWQYGHQFVVKVYKITKEFPKNESYGIVGQLRRSAVSITSNIAEGFSRFSYRDRLKFYYIARGSLSECQNLLLIAQDVDYLDKDRAKELLSRIETIRRIINGLIRATAKLTK